MPHCAKVSIRHGPYESCGIVEHRTERLKGMQAILIGHGHTIAYEQVTDWNIVELIVNGEVIYKCDIRDLDFGGDGQLDKLCAEALKAVEEAF